MHWPIWKCIYHNTVFTLTPVRANDNVNTQAKPGNQNRGPTVINLLKPLLLFNPCKLTIISFFFCVKWPLTFFTLVWVYVPSSVIDDVKLCVKSLLTFFTLVWVYVPSSVIDDVKLCVKSPLTSFTLVWVYVPSSAIDDGVC